MSDEEFQITTTDMLEIAADSDNVAEYPDIRGLIEKAAKELRKKDEEISNLREVLKPLSDEERIHITDDAHLMYRKSQFRGVRGQVITAADSIDYWAIEATMAYLRARALLNGENI